MPTVAILLMKDNLSRKLKAYEFATDIIKQYSNLSVIIVTFTATFAQKISEKISVCSKFIAISIWILYLLSLILGLAAQQKLTAEIEPDYGRELTIKNSDASKLASAQIILFYIALILTVIFGVTQLFFKVSY